MIDNMSGHSNARANAPVQIPDDAEPDTLLTILHMIWRGKWAVLSIALVPLLLSILYAFVIAVPQYTARAQLALEVQRNEIADVASLVSGSSTESTAINTELQIMRSRKLIAAVVDELNLTNEPAFNPVLRDPTWLERIRIQIGLMQPPDSVSEGGQRERTINAVRRAVSAVSRRGTYILEIQVTSSDRALASDIANALAEIYMREQISTKFESTEYAVEWLSARVSELEIELFEKEEAVKDQRASMELIDEDALNALIVRAQLLRDRIARYEEGGAETGADVLRELHELGDRQAIAAETGDVTLRNLAAQIAEGSEEAEAAFDRRFEMLIEGAATSRTADRTRKEALERSLADLEDRIELRSRDVTILTQMQREAEATRVLYETFLARLKEASLQIGFQRADSYMMEPARAAAMVAPSPPLLLTLGLIVGLIFGALVVVLRQFLDNGIKTASQLEKGSGIMVLGHIPLLPIRKRAGLVEYLRDNPTSGPVEAIRNLRTSILLSDTKNPPQIILSTSSVPGEGKTTQAIALAGTLKGIDKKVLLIGGDIRRRAIVEYFPNLKEANLQDVLSTDGSYERFVTHDERLGIDVITGSHSKTINPANLFSSERFRDFLTELRESYDFIVIDTPPLLLVPDARILAQYADAVIMAVRWNRTPLAQLKEGVRQLSSVGVRPTGLSLTQVNTRKLASYSYDGAYGYYDTYADGEYT